MITEYRVCQKQVLPREPSFRFLASSEVPLWETSYNFILNDVYFVFSQRILSFSEALTARDGVLIEGLDGTDMALRP